MAAYKGRVTISLTKTASTSGACSSGQSPPLGNNSNLSLKDLRTLALAVTPYDPGSFTLAKSSVTAYASGYYQFSVLVCDVGGQLRTGDFPFNYIAFPVG